MQEPVIPRQHAAVERARANPPLRALTHRPVLPAYQVEKRYDRAGVEVSPRCYLWTEEILADHPRSVWSRRKTRGGPPRARRRVGERVGEGGEPGDRACASLGGRGEEVRE